MRTHSLSLLFRCALDLLKIEIAPSQGKNGNNNNDNNNNDNNNNDWK